MDSYSGGVVEENFDQIPIPLPHEVYKLYPRFELTLQEGQPAKLVIRCDDEQELQDAWDTWEDIVIPMMDTKVVGIHEHRNGEPTKVPLFPGSTCPNCGGKLITRRGRYNRFLGCNQFPQCRFSQSL